MEKTLIGKEDYLFLINDSCKELEIHCNNLNLVDPHKVIISHIVIYYKLSFK